MMDKSPLARSTNNMAKLAKMSSMGSFGLVPGPVDGVSLNHPERSKNWPTLGKQDL